MKRFLLKSLIGFLILFTASIFYAAFLYRDYRIELASQSRLADTEKGTIEYQLVGENGPVILFLHGTPGGYDQFSRPNGEYARKSRFLIPSRPGYLRTPLEVGRTPEQQADAYAALLDTLSIESVIVMAASGGGPSALEFSIKYAERTDALISLVALNQPENEPPFEGPETISIGVDFTYWLVYECLLFFSPRTVFSRIFEADDLERVLSNPETLARLRSLARAEFPAAWRMAGARNDSLQKPSLDIPFELINAPTLIIHGTEDGNVDYSQALELSERVQHSELLTIPGGGHLISFTHPEVISKAIGEFLDKHGLLDLDLNTTK